MPTRRRKDDRPGEIIDAAIDVFAERGFSGATVAEIATQAGVAKGTVYLYFETKDEIFVEVVNQHIRPVFAPIETALDSFDGSMQQFLTQMVKRVYQELVRDQRRRTILRILVAEGNRFPQLVEFYYENVIGRVRQMLQTILIQGVDRGEFKAGADQIEPMVVMAPAMLAVIWKIVFEDVQPLELDSYCQSHLSVVFGGILK